MALKIQLESKDAIEKAFEQSGVKKMLSEDNVFLSSAFAIVQPEANEIKSWIVNFFSRETKNITSVHVSQGSVEVKAPSPMVNEKSVKPVCLSNVSVKSASAVNLAVGENEKHHGKSDQSKIFITLHNNEDYLKECWTITFLSPNLSTHTVKIDETNGAVVSSVRKSLLAGSNILKK